MLALTQHAGEFLLRDDIVAHPRDGLAALHAAEVGVHAEQRERRHDQDQENDLDQLLVLVNEIKHVGLCIPLP
ncbi:hypothetical protein D3C83_92300 [compost metagenome]